MKFWGWFLQRITGLLLLVLLLVHILATHFSAPAETITYNAVSSRLKVPGFIMVDYLLLFLGIAHGLYGLYIVVLDTSRERINRTGLTVVMMGLGLVLSILGAYTLTKFFA